MNVHRPQRNYGCRIHDQGTYLGMRTIVLENDLVRVSYLLDKGADLFEFQYKPAGLDYVWLSENGVQNPNAYLPTSTDLISTFIDYYPGGWQEVFPNGGPTSAYAVTQFGQHGEVAHMRWDYTIVTDSVDCIAVTFSVRTKKVPFHLSRTVTLERQSPALTIQETLTNLSRVPLQFMWGQHVAFGKPFLEPGCRIVLPDSVEVLTETTDKDKPAAGRIARGRRHAWPLAESAGGGTVDLSVTPEPQTASDVVYLHGFGERGWYKVENERLGAGLHLEWDASVMPYVWY
ncbi:DUF4432 family protein [Paenibacillus filicis]|uniref:DUF4432 family protein n=1 Tax=Paenibacillus filicis TaxID=669464 RepID=A0ABU9DJR9_9BACL